MLDDPPGEPVHRFRLALFGRGPLRRPWVTAVTTALAIAAAAILATAAWSFTPETDAGWPEGAAWWVVVIVCSAVVAIGLIVAIVSLVRSTAVISAVVLGWSLAAFAVSIASWGQFAADANAGSTRADWMRECGKELKSMSIEDVAVSRYMSAVMMVRPMAAQSLYMIETPTGFGARMADQQRRRGVRDECIP